ncbi:hypothetical protein RB195_024292 [Necator americanus]|uniref:Reverse transcriptase domain-containing protein n=1 Tax=Necator americanus TaxID=51031 RepID=A0ABR1EMR6_NECAM
MQLALLDFEAAFAPSSHRSRLLNALLADGVPETFVRLLDIMNQRTTASVRTPAGYITPFEVVTGVRQGAMAEYFLFNFIIDTHVTVSSTGLEYADDVVISAESSTKLQNVINLVSKLAAAYGLRLRPEKYKQMKVEVALLVKAIIENDLLKTTRDMAQKLGVDHSRVVRHLERIGNVEQSVPHELSESQGNRGFENCPTRVIHF